MTLSLDDLQSRAGHLLWRELPEEYRYRDPAVVPPPEPDKDHPDKPPRLPPEEPGDLQAFLHAMGHLLDLVRGTTEQLYADSFAEPPEGGRSIQPWLLPYLAELTGAELTAPDPDNRLVELGRTVGWFKSKGTLASVDEVSDVVTGLETVPREGWRLVLACPRLGLPPFTLPPGAEADATLGTGLPLGTPDLRRLDRPVQDAAGVNPLYRLRQPTRDALGLPTAPAQTFWRPLSPGGLPAFAESYADGMARTPDLRAGRGPHPRRVALHVRPPDGLFAAGLRVVVLDGTHLTPPVDGKPLIVTPALALERAGHADDPIPDRLVIRMQSDVPVASGRSLVLQDVLLTGEVAGAPIRVKVAPGARLTLLRAAAQHVSLEGEGPSEGGLPGPSLIARDSLLGRISGGVGFARLEFCTVQGETDVTTLQASDCILGGLTSNLKCSATTPPLSCLRHCRATPGEAACLTAGGRTNTTARPIWAPRWRAGSPPTLAPPTLAPPAWGEPGFAVLSHDAPVAITDGAEGGGEMGAHHHLHLAAGLRALARKLTSFLPIGQEIALFHDPLLALTPPKLKEDAP